MFRYSRRWVVGYIEIVKDDSALFACAYAVPTIVGVGKRGKY